MKQTIWCGSNPTTFTNFLTAYKSEADAAIASGAYKLEDDRFLAAMTASTGTVAVHRLYNAKTVDFTSESAASRISALIAQGFADKGIQFYASPSQIASTWPVFRYVKGAKHSYALALTDQRALSAAGWAQDGISFYAMALPGDQGSPTSPTTTPTTSTATPTGTATTTTATPTGTATTTTATPTGTATTTTATPTGTATTTTATPTGTATTTTATPTGTATTTTTATPTGTATTTTATPTGTATTTTATPTGTATTTASASSTPFTVAVFPDTQLEALPQAGELYNQQMQDVVNRRDAQNIKFAISVGDVVNANSNPLDTASPPGQYDRMSMAFSILTGAGIPFTIAGGNHDSAAVCGAGGACIQYNPDGTQIPVNTLLRNTTIFNSRVFNMVQKEGVYQAGHAENSFTTYQAGGVNWLVLNIELWPRQAALDWAKSVVASHPTYNVIVVSHSLMSGDGVDPTTGVDMTGTIYPTNGGYGNLPPKAIYDQLILAYPNVKLALCGHKTGIAHRMDTGVGGNKVATILTAFHTMSFNPTRFLSIDAANGTVSSQIRASAQLVGSLAVDPNYAQYDTTISGLSFIKP